MSTKVVRRSALQKNILSLYAQFVRVSKEKPGVLERVRREFKEGAKLPKDNTLHIESMLRRAKNQLNMLRSNQVTSIQKITIKKI